MGTHSYRDLEVWQVAMELAEQCYLATKRFPKEELFGLTSQIRRAASSIPANIAEGQGRQHIKEFLQFLGVAKGSLYELETHVELSKRVGLLSAEESANLLDRSDRVGKMLTRLRQALESRS